MRVEIEEVVEVIDVRGRKEKRTRDERKRKKTS